MFVLTSLTLGKLYFDMRDENTRLILRMSDYEDKTGHLQTQVKACMLGRTNRDALVDCLRAGNCDGG